MQFDKIHLFSMERRMAKYKDSILSAIDQVISGSTLILGPVVENFEQSFADYLQITHAIGVANGTDALEIALKALGIPEGSVVGTVANAANYSSLASMASGMTPHYLDINPSTLLLDLDSVKKGLPDDCNALVITHLYGSPVPETKAIVDYCHSIGIYVIEDCSQAHGAHINLKKVGTFGDVATFSFYPTKNLGGIGDGGMIVTSSDSVAGKARQLRQYGWSDKYKIDLLGGRNSRLDAVQAAILDRMLVHLDEENETRRTLSNRITREVNNSVVHFLETAPGSVYHLLVLKTQHRSSLVLHLNQLGIEHGVHYPFIDSCQVGRSTVDWSENLPCTSVASDQILTIPMHPYLREDEVLRIVDALNGFKIIEV